MRPNGYCSPVSLRAHAHARNDGLNVRVNIHRAAVLAAKRSRWISVIYAVTAVARSGASNVFSNIRLGFRLYRRDVCGPVAAFMSALKFYCRSDTISGVARVYIIKVGVK